MCIIEPGIIVEIAKYAAVFIAICNGALPTIMKILNSFEPHPNTTAQEASLLFGFVAARDHHRPRCLRDHPVEGHCDQREDWWSAGLLADAVTTPTIRFDMAGWFNKLVMAPMVKTQEGMHELQRDRLVPRRAFQRHDQDGVRATSTGADSRAYLIAAIALFYNFCRKYCLLRGKSSHRPTRDRRRHAHLAGRRHPLHHDAPLHAAARQYRVQRRGRQSPVAHSGEVQCYYETDDGDKCDLRTEGSDESLEVGDFIYFHVRSYMRDDQAYSVVLYMVITFLAMILVTTLYSWTFGFTVHALRGSTSDNSKLRSTRISRQKITSRDSRATTNRYFIRRNECVCPTGRIQRHQQSSGALGINRSDFLFACINT